MGIDAKHAYRFRFLSSEEWSGIRKSILSRTRAECCCCGVIDWSNDVHHLKYPKTWSKTSKTHSVVLCRECHNTVHLLFGKDMPTDNAWLFQKSIAEAFKLHGFGMTSHDVMDQIDLFHSQKWDERRRFCKAMEKAKREIRKYLIVVSHPVCY